ncbi:REF/SRPP-like protein At3g05500 isoform X1 [Prosopis cineraria]|uniref:REF/SRPP-like protein At3g05500 isoform X1 n=1 Tax=Prosopis cineraria TaxID=364024 RepID=UPI002410385E|nr:REF/SRPP-like protein At3g05500 isoform X1 [Prosopis cineraria]XP_054822827.1 REF/SRPP-like protein At3g05500 isoform X1 [Prosopis cineraria]
MAEEFPQSQQHLATREDEPGLKYLAFVQVAAIHALMRFSILYAYAKEHSGPLKPGVESVEGTVKSVIRPVYDKFHDVPVEVLKYVDRKVRVEWRNLSCLPLFSANVGDSLTELDRHVPSNIKKASAQAFTVAQKAPEAARTVVSEVRRAGVVDTASGLAKSAYSKYEPTAKELYAKFEPKAEQCAVSAWQKLNKLPMFPQVASAVIPTAAFCTEKYNQTVVYTAQKGYRVSTYLPLVPTEKIARIFGENKA